MVAAFALAALAAAPSAFAAPINSAAPAPSLPDFSGKAFKASPIKSATKAPQNPFMAKNQKSNIHNDTWMTGTYSWPGPLGRNLVTNSGAAANGICSTIAFDSRGRIVTVCVSTVAAPQARIIDPDTLAVLDTFDLPNTDPVGNSPAYQNFSAGGYFFLNNRDQLVIPTRTNHIFVLGQTPDGSEFQLVKDYDLTSVVDPETERMNSALPDFQGLIWFVVKQTGEVGTLNTKTGLIRVLRLNEGIQNSFTVDRGAIYVVTSKRLYKLGKQKNGKPTVKWKVKYRNDGKIKPGQADAGTGTTPDILSGGYVTIVDNANPENIVVYRTADKLKGKKRKVCEVPVFSRNGSATENSLITTGRSIIVENNYGYTDIFAPDANKVVTKAGFARVDVRKDGKGCTKVWTNRTERAPSVVPKMSSKTGLIYAYTRPPDPSGSQGYYWSAIDFKTGKTAWNKYAGSGFFFNNNYSGLGLGPDGTAYVGVIGGIVSLKDGN
ncbi:MAG: hypothetical protein KDB52_00305 [Solirubrobacterales bacterium]|nr:hypothetical protein [Solirubrobacterales bacterium]